MVLGLVPAPALAEAMEEVSSPTGSAIQVADPQGQTTGQPKGQALGEQAPGGQAPSGHAPDGQVSNGEGTKPVGGEPAKEGSQALPTDPVGLTVQGDGDGQPEQEYTPFLLNTSVGFSLETGGSMWGSFTAPETGVYDFTVSVTGSSVYFVLGTSVDTPFAGEWATSADDNGGNEVPGIITRYMQKDEQVFLGVGPNDGERQIQGSVIVQTSTHSLGDLAIGRLQFNRDSYTIPDDQIILYESVTDCRGEFVDAAYYDLEFYTRGDDGNMIPCDGVPNEAGEYFVSAKAKEGNAGGYSGQTEIEYNRICINDRTNLKSPWWYIGFLGADGSTSDLVEVPYTGEPVQIPQVTVWRDGDDGEDIVLNQGTDFTVSIDGGLQSIKDVDEYTIRANGVGDYSGTSWNWLHVRVTGSDYDLSRGRLVLHQNSYHMSDEPVRISCSAYDCNDSMVGDDTYSLVFYDAVDATQPLDSAPTEAGTYWVAARGNGTEQEGYFRETPKTQFEIMGQNNISDYMTWYCSLAPNIYIYWWPDRMAYPEH